MGSSLRDRLAGGPALLALYETAVAAARGERDVSAVAQLAAERACDLLGVDGASVFVWNQAVGRLEPLFETAANKQSSVRPGEGMAGKAFAKGLPVQAEDYQRYPGRLAPAAARGMRGALMVPMHHNGEPIGALGVWTRAKRAFGPEEVTLLSEFASHLGPAIAGARAAEEREHQNQVFRTLLEFAVAAPGIHEVAPLSRLAVEKAAELLTCDGAFLAWWNEEEEELRPLADIGSSVAAEWSVRRGEGAVGLAFQRRAPVVVDDYAKWRHATAAGLESGSGALLAVPLSVQDKALGVLGVRALEPRVFTAGDTELMTLLASQVAPALEVVRLLESSKGQVRGLRSLHEVAVAASGVLDPSALARLTVDHARDLLGVESAVLRWWDPAAGVLRLLASNDPHPRHQVPEITPDKGAIGAAFRRQEPVIIDNYGAQTPSVPWAVEDQVKTAMAVPLLVGLRPVGALCVATYTPHKYDPAQIRLLTLCAAQVAPALEAARLAEERERQSRTLRAMQQLAAAASGVLEPAVLAELTIDRARELLGADSAGLAWWDSSARVLRFISDHLVQSAGRTQERGQGMAGQAFERGEPVLVDDFQAWDGAEPAIRRLGYRSAMSVPLMVHDRAVGGMVIRSRAKRHFNPEEVLLLSLIAAQVAPALEAARLHSDLASSERQFRSLYEAMACGVIVRDAEGTGIEVNDAACLILEATREELLKSDLGSIPGWRRIRDDTSEMPSTEMPAAVAMRTRRAVRSQVVRITKGGREVYLQVDCVPISDADGELERLVISFIDVTSVKLAETARRENEAKSRFLAAMSHELRTPLNSILGFAQLLQRAEFGELDERQGRYVDNIASSGRHLLDMVNDVLDLSKVAAGQMEIFLEDFEMTALLRESVAKVRPLADAKQLDLSMAARSKPWVHGDRRRVEQVFWNLLSNAIKFTPDGGRVDVGARSVDGTVRITVTDSGIGVPADQQERIFEEFTQVDDTRSRSHQGTGLGLPLSRRLVQLMGGELSLESRPGSGSIFTVVLPRASRSHA